VEEGLHVGAEGFVVAVDAVQCAGLRPMRGCGPGEDRGDDLVAEGEEGGDGAGGVGRDVVAAGAAGAAGAGFASVTVACEPTGHRWRVLDQLAAERGLALVCVQPLLVYRSREGEDLTRDRSDPKDAVLIARLASELRCYEPERTDAVWARLRWLADRAGQLPALAAGSALTALSLAGLGVIAAAAAGPVAAAVSVAAIAGYGFGAWSITPPQQQRLLADGGTDRFLLSLNASALCAGSALAAPPQCAGPRPASNWPPWRWWAGRHSARSSPTAVPVVSSRAPPSVAPDSGRLRAQIARVSSSTIGAAPGRGGLRNDGSRALAIEVPAGVLGDLRSWAGRTRWLERLPYPGLGGRYGHRLPEGAGGLLGGLV
jgi:Transposase